MSFRKLFSCFFYCILLLPGQSIYGQTSGEIRTLIDKSGFTGTSISQSELELLEEGEPVFTFFEDIQDSSLSPNLSEGQNILKKYKDIDPNFLIESFFILPLKDGSGEEVLQEVKQFLMDIESFEEIPYWSEERQKYFNLFDRIEVKERMSFDDGSRGIQAEQRMKPFKPYEAQYRYWMRGNDFIYTSWNFGPIHYRFVKAVKEENMFTSLFVHAEEDALFFYGLGGVRAFTFFGMFGERMETSFTGRTEAFFRWFHKEFVLTRIK